MTRLALVLFIALGVALTGCAKSKSPALQSRSTRTPTTQVSHTKVKPATGLHESTGVKPIAPAASKPMSSPEKKIEPAKSGTSSISSTMKSTTEPKVKGSTSAPVHHSAPSTP